jgi:hypothetical protein
MVSVGCEGVELADSSRKGFNFHEESFEDHTREEQNLGSMHQT